MYSSLVRAQNVFGLFTSVAFAVAALIAATDLITPRTPSVASLKTTNVRVYVFWLLTAFNLLQLLIHEQTPEFVAGHIITRPNVQTMQS